MSDRTHDEDDGQGRAEFLQVSAYREGDRIEFEVTVEEWALLWDKPAIAALLWGACDAVRLAAEDFGPPVDPRDGRPPLRSVPPTSGGDDDAA